MGGPKGVELGRVTLRQLKLHDRLVPKGTELRIINPALLTNRLPGSDLTNTAASVLADSPVVPLTWEGAGSLIDQVSDSFVRVVTPQPKPVETSNFSFPFWAETAGAYLQIAGGTPVKVESGRLGRVKPKTPKLLVDSNGETKGATVHLLTTHPLSDGSALPDNYSHLNRALAIVDKTLNGLSELASEELVYLEQEGDRIPADEIEVYRIIQELLGAFPTRNENLTMLAILFRELDSLARLGITEAHTLLAERLEVGEPLAAAALGESARFSDDLARDTLLQEGVFGSSAALNQLGRLYAFTFDPEARAVINNQAEMGNEVARAERLRIETLGRMHSPSADPKARYNLVSNADAAYIQELTGRMKGGSIQAAALLGQLAHAGNSPAQKSLLAAGSKGNPLALMELGRIAAEDEDREALRTLNDQAFMGSSTAFLEMAKLVATGKIPASDMLVNTGGIDYLFTTVNILCSLFDQGNDSAGVLLENIALVGEPLVVGILHDIATREPKFDLNRHGARAAIDVLAMIGRTNRAEAGRKAIDVLMELAPQHQYILEKLSEMVKKDQDLRAFKALTELVYRQHKGALDELKGLGEKLFADLAKKEAELSINLTGTEPKVTLAQSVVNGMAQGFMRLCKALYGQQESALQDLAQMVNFAFNRLSQRREPTIRAYRPRND